MHLHLDPSSMFLNRKMDLVIRSLRRLEKKLMPIKDELDQITASEASEATALGTIATNTGTIADDLTAQNALIADLKAQLANSTITPEAQAALDALVPASATNTANVQAAAAALQAVVDAQTGTPAVI